MSATVTQLALREGELLYEERDERPLTASEIRVRVAYVGICGSELHAIEEAVRDGGGGSGVLGHEYSGVIEEIGTDVRDVGVGDRVVCKPRLPCMRCYPCAAGRIWDCDDLRRPALGAWAQTIVVDAQFAVRVPSDVSLRQAALAEPLSCCLRAVDIAQMTSGHKALVIGGGPIGLLVGLLERHAGADDVLVAEKNRYRRELATRLGLTALDPEAEELSEIVTTRSRGRGFDVIYEAVGSARTVELAVACARRGTHIVVLGVAPREDIARIKPFDLFAKELKIAGAWAIETSFLRAVGLLRTIGAENIITHEFPLNRGRDAIELAGSGNCGKVLLRPNESLH